MENSDMKNSDMKILGMDSVQRAAAAPVRLPMPLPTAAAGRYRPAPGSILEHVTDGGLRIVAVRRPSVPVVELRLAVPFGGSEGGRAATAELLAAALLGSTARRDRAGLRDVLGSAGGSLRAEATPELLTVQGAFAADGLGPVLAVLGEVLADPWRPRDEVLAERDRLAHRLETYRAQPRTVARETLLEHCFPGHPLTGEVPRPEAVAAVEDGDVAVLHERALVPGGSRLLLVGDLDPLAAVAAAERALRAWTGPHPASGMPPLPDPARGIAVAERSGGRQVQIRLLAPAPGIEEPGYQAARLANLVLGASFRSRLTARLRERDGLTYSVHSGIAEHAGRGLLTIGFDTGPTQLGAALTAVREELDRFAGDGPPDEAEIEAARGYAAGSLAIMLASQNGTADLLHRLPLATAYEAWLTGQAELIGRTGDAEVRLAARRMASASFSGILLAAPEQADLAARETEAAGFTMPAR